MGVIIMENKTFTKEEVSDFLKEKYNPNETTIELADLWDFFGITEEDLLDDVNQKNSACNNTRDGVKCGEVYAEEEGIKRKYICNECDAEQKLDEVKG